MSFLPTAQPSQWRRLAAPLTLVGLFASVAIFTAFPSLAEETEAEESSGHLQTFRELAALRKQRALLLEEVNIAEKRALELAATLRAKNNSASSVVPKGSSELTHSEAEELKLSPALTLIVRAISEIPKERSPLLLSGELNSAENCLNSKEIEACSEQELLKVLRLVPALVQEGQGIRKTQFMLNTEDGRRMPAFRIDIGHALSLAVSESGEFSALQIEKSWLPLSKEASSILASARAISQGKQEPELLALPLPSDFAEKRKK